MTNKKNFLVSLGLALLITFAFIGAAMFKTNISVLDISLGAVWSFVLSLIVSFSLFHASDKTEPEKNKTAKQTPIFKDPVCGMETNGKITTEYRGQTYGFCSKHCQDQFQKNPKHYGAE